MLREAARAGPHGSQAELLLLQRAATPGRRLRPKLGERGSPKRSVSPQKVDPCPDRARTGTAGAVSPGPPLGRGPRGSRGHHAGLGPAGPSAALRATLSPGSSPRRQEPAAPRLTAAPSSASQPGAGQHGTTCPFRKLFIAHVQDQHTSQQHRQPHGRFPAPAQRPGPGGQAAARPPGAQPPAPRRSGVLPRSTAAPTPPQAWGDPA